MKPFYLLLGAESALAERALSKLHAELKSENAQITTIFASDAQVGDISDAVAPSLFADRRALVIKDLQDLPEDTKEEVTRYLDSPDPTMTVIFIHKGGVKGKALLDAIKKAKPEIIACEAIKKDSDKDKKEEKSEDKSDDDSDSDDNSDSDSKSDDDDKSDDDKKSNIKKDNQKKLAKTS